MGGVEGQSTDSLEQAVKKKQVNVPIPSSSLLSNFHIVHFVQFRTKRPPVANASAASSTSRDPGPESRTRTILQNQEEP